MLKDFNLLVTTARGTEEDACSEIWYLVGEIGDAAVRVERTGITGLIAAKTILDPFVVVEKFRLILKERPYEFRYSLRIIPVEKVVRTDLAEIQKATIELSSKIERDESFRVTVEKRFSSTHTKDIIEAVATAITHQVDLKHPDKIVLVEVVGGLTGISILKSSEILSISKERM